ncbi:MAG: endonuclease [Blastochloris sp.]|nr:endonuclease [Blastochloris sp.]
MYLLHFDARICPTHPCQHYLGYSDDINRRMAMHQRGRGARLVRVARERGITWRLVRIWPGDRRLERYLKQLKNAPKLCPICQAEGRGTEPLVDTTSAIPF